MMMWIDDQKNESLGICVSIVVTMTSSYSEKKRKQREKL